MNRVSRVSLWWLLALVISVGFAINANARPLVASARTSSGPPPGHVYAPDYVPPPSPPPIGHDGGDPDEIGIDDSFPSGNPVAIDAQSGSLPTGAPKIGTGLRLVLWVVSLRMSIRGW